MGVYIVDYEGSNPGTLQNSGNRGTNVKHTFDEESYHWNRIKLLQEVTWAVMRPAIFFGEK